MEVNFSILITFILYLAFMVAIGLIFYSKTNNLSDYILGGRQLNKWVVALSAEASDMSGWLLLGLPGLAYVVGVEAAWIALGLAAGTYLNWKFVAARLRNYTQISGDAITLSNYFENRFRDKSKALRMVSALFIVIFFLIYTASGFVASGKLFSTVFGLTYFQALLIGALVVVIYTFLGGFMAVCWTDLFQGLLMLFAIIVVPMAGMKAVGGYGALISAIKAANPERLNLFTTLEGTPISAMVVISSLAWGLGYFGQPHILVRFMAIKSPEQIKPATRIAMIWVLLSLIAAVSVGVVGSAYLPNALEGPATETIFMVMVDRLFHPLMAGLLLAAILAAIMSTADSQLLVTASALAEDFYKVLFRKEASDKELVRVGRLAVVLVSVVAFIIALDQNSSVLDLVAYAWAGFGATFGPIILLSLFWKRMTRNGALAGIVAGGGTAFLWKQLQGGIFELYEIVPGFLCSVIAIVLFSLLDKKPADEIIEEFDMVSGK
ncbi:MAG TPA: sodium/proline symporter PutP [Firmicutes bacterium]|nr:sodium/proline symporter PutP [Bacillota bacterium]